MKVINPFSISLAKYPIQELQDSDLVFQDGDFRVFRKYSDYFVHTFKNVVIAERCAINKAIFSALKGELVPKDEAIKYFEFDRPKWAINEAIKNANRFKFLIQ